MTEEAKAHLSKLNRKQFCVRGHDTHIVGRRLGGWGTCRACSRIYETNNRVNQTPERKASVALATIQANWRRAGIKNESGETFTRIDYDRAYQIQHGRCGGCLAHQSELKRALCVDHDHATGFFRGLLCHHCNFALGSVKDNVEVMKRLTNYLEAPNGHWT